MLETEKRNPKSMNLHVMANERIIQMMADQNRIIQQAILNSTDEISQAIDLCVSALRNNARMIYMGAGTSGRLGVLDAAECVPTFNIDPKRVVGLIAGGSTAMLTAVEGAEDDEQLGQNDLQTLGLDANDVVIGIAASGRTPYVIGGLDYANRIGARTIAISNNLGSYIGKISNVAIELETGAEILTGSTRLAAGTAQKETLNLISTITMVRIGKVYSNLMIDVRPSNQKLQQRAINIVSQVAQVSTQVAEQALKDAHNEVSEAIVMIISGVNADRARTLLATKTVAELLSEE